MKPRDSERGTALVVTLILALATAGTTAALAQAARDLAEDVAVRREALCARYAARAGIALGPALEDRAAMVDESVTSLQVSAVLKAPGWCVYRSTGVCGRARRTVERTVDPTNCGS